MNGIQKLISGSTVEGHILLSGHNASLPASANCFDNGKGDNALTNFPFFKTSTLTWGIKATGSRGGNSWEADSYNGNHQYNTYHQVWVR